ncbi:MAG TPA: hypothetical protein VEF04_05480 [Blastocatellia bacterium]|nr:hypothetical protein [Blastocatellia bacterium]
MRKISSKRKRGEPESLLFERFKRRIDGFNQRPLGMDDLYQECEKRKIFIGENPFRRVHGCSFYDDDGQPCLIVNSLIAEPYRIVAGYHELAHLLDHAPDPEAFLSLGSLWNNHKLEFQAQMIGVVALIPKELMLHFDFAELETEYGFPRDLITLRAHVLRQYAV